MARGLNAEDIARINELYIELKTYAAVARTLGVAPATVKKYVDPNYGAKVESKAAAAVTVTPATYEIPSIDKAFAKYNEPKFLLVMTEEEVAAVRQLQREEIVA